MPVFESQSPRRREKSGICDSMLRKLRRFKGATGGPLRQDVQGATAHDGQRFHERPTMTSVVTESHLPGKTVTGIDNEVAMVDIIFGVV